MKYVSLALILVSCGSPQRSTRDQIHNQVVVTEGVYKDCVGVIINREPSTVDIKVTKVLTTGTYESICSVNDFIYDININSTKSF